MLPALRGLRGENCQESSGFPLPRAWNLWRLHCLPAVPAGAMPLPTSSGGLEYARQKMPGIV